MYPINTIQTLKKVGKKRNLNFKKELNPPYLEERIEKPYFFLTIRLGVVQKEPIWWLWLLSRTEPIAN